MTVWLIVGLLLLALLIYIADEFGNSDDGSDTDLPE